jgi:hypothetical protein
MVNAIANQGKELASLSPAGLAAHILGIDKELSEVATTTKSANGF